MRLLMNRWFYCLHEANDDAGMASFEEVFGRPPEEAFNRPNPFDGLDDGEGDDDADDADGDAAAGGDSGDASDEGDQGDDGGDDDGTPALAEWEVEMSKRFAPGTFTEEGWKAFRSLEVEYSRRPPAPPEPPAAPEPPVAPPRRLLPGSTGEINTEEDLFGLAQTSPQEAAMWALDNRDRLSPDQYNTVMNVWFASNPQEYLDFRDRAILQAQQENMQQMFQHETALQMENARGTGLKEALAENPLIDQYRPQLGQYMLDNPHLNDWVNSLRTTHEVKSAVEAIFYMMAGPELGKQVLEHKATQEAARLEAERIAAANGTAAEGSAAAARTTRRSAQPRTTAPAGSQISEEEYAKGIQDKILNMPAR